MAQQSVFDDRYPRPKQQKKEGDSFSASLGNDDTLETVFERTGYRLPRKRLDYDFSLKKVPGQG